MQPVVGGKINVKTLFILAKIRRPHAAVVGMQRGAYRAPVDKVSRMPDQQPGRVIKTRVREIEAIADTDWTGVGVITAHDRVVVCPRGGLGQGQIAPRTNRHSCGYHRSILYKAAARDHSG